MEIGVDTASAGAMETRLIKSRDRLLHEVAEAVGGAFDEIATLARETVDTAQQQCEAESSGLRSQLSEALDELERQHAEARRLIGQLATERARRESAEASRTTFEAEQQQALANHAALVRALEEQLETARKETVRMASALESAHAEHRRVQVVLDSIRSVIGSGAVPALTRSPGAELDAIDVQESPSAAAAVAVNPPASEPGQHVQSGGEGQMEDRPECSEYASQLLEQIESAYQHDVDTSERPSDVVDHLTEYLRIARSLFSTRFTDDPAVTSHFDRQVTTVLDAKGTTPFGRHLAIAWYAASHPIECETK
jgi:hypothetical protein